MLSAMNSKERDLLNWTHKLGSAALAGERLGLKPASVGYYSRKWEAKGWMDEDGNLTEAAPPFELTLRQQLLEAGHGLGLG